MKYVIVMLAAAMLCGGCIFGPKAETEKPEGGNVSETTPVAPPENQKPPEDISGPAEVPPEDGAAGPVEKPPEVVVPKPAIPVADAETQKKIDEAIAKFKDKSAKWDEREDALLKTLVGIGAIATPDVLRLTYDTGAEAGWPGMALKFFYLLPEKERSKGLVYQLFSDDSNMRTAAVWALAQLTGMREMGYDANADEAARYEAIKKWAAALGVEEILGKG
jgi:hypothetical protein